MASRVDSKGRAYKGSQLQTQLWVNRRQAELNQKVLSHLPSLKELRPALDWVSPMEKRGFREYHDRPFLDRLGYGDLSDALKHWWPRGGAHWDALAVVRNSAGEPRGVLLAEGKSYPAEMRGLGTASGKPRGGKPPSAQSKRNLRRIQGALRDTRRALGVPDSYGGAWLRGPYYQAANRLAHLRFFEHQGVPAWLAQLYFVNDLTSGKRKATPKATWLEAFDDERAALGLTGRDVPNLAHITLEAGTRDELLAPPKA